VDSGSISGGTVKLKKSEAYKKRDSVTINLYARKWFLGGKGKWLASRKIPYNYEDSIVLLSNGNNDRSPGDHLKFGVRTIYDDKQFADVWFPVKKKAGGHFLLGFDGAHLSKSKGDLKIDDASRVHNDRIRLFARLAKDSAIGDTLSLLLDYTAQYNSLIRSGDAGHPLGVDVSLLDDSIIHAQLLRVEVYDSVAKKGYHYLVNVSGGSLAISSKGGDNGFDGGNIVVHYSALAAPFIACVKAMSVPGAGGSGGRGGTGGSGGSGGQGSPSGNSGSKGLDGRDGFNGDSGKAGVVRFVQDR
jgi:hypothetical protein